MASRRLFAGTFVALIVLTLSACGARTPAPDSETGPTDAGADRSPDQTRQAQEAPAPGAVRYRAEVLEAVAQALRQKDLLDDGGPAVYGLAMQEALSAFQRRQELEVTGRIDSATARALDVRIPEEGLRYEPGEVESPYSGEPAPRVAARIESPKYSADRGGVVWEERVDYRGARDARLWVRSLDLGDGDRLQVVDAQGDTVASYEGTREGFWTPYFALPGTLRIVASEGGGGAGVTVSRAQIHLVPEERDAAEDTAGAESIIGGDDSNPIADFGTGSEIYVQGAPVAALVDDSGTEFCSSFLIGPDRLMTNNHCIADQDECDDATARFNYQDDADGNALTTTDYDCEDVLQTDFTLDYTVVELEGRPGYDWGYLRLSEDNVYDGEELTITGHPAGVPKRVSRTDCAVAEPVSDSPRDGTEATDISYRCDTRGGSSGSPVFDLRHYEVVALHHWGLGADVDNEGVRMRRILADCSVCAKPYAPPGKAFDVDDDGRADAFIRSPNWAGVIRGTASGFELSWIESGRVGKWNLGIDNWERTGDVDGDGYGDVVMRSPEWIGILRGGTSGLGFTWLTHDRVDGWNLGFDDRFRLADYDGDGDDDVVMRSDEWIGLLRSDGSSLSLEWITSDWLGDWNLGRADRFWVGDFTGDGRDDVFVRSPEWAGLFRSTGSALEEVWMVHDWLDSWNMGDRDDHWVGDFDGDGRDDLLTRSNEYISVWRSTGTGFEVVGQEANWIGGWNLGWPDWHRVGDFDGDGSDDVLIRSRNWVGLLESAPDGSLSNAWMESGWLGGWNLSMPDQERVGDFDGDGMADVLVRSPNWIGRFVSTGSALREDFITEGRLAGWNLGYVDRLAGGR